MKSVGRHSRIWQDRRGQPLAIWVDDLLLRSWRPTDAEDIVRARDDAAISRRARSGDA